jgi:hypothetical protein
MPTDDDIDALACQIHAMSRPQLIDAIRTCRCPFPVDFTDDFLATCALDRLRHYVLGLKMYAARAQPPQRTIAPAPIPFPRRA